MTKREKIYLKLINLNNSLTLPPEGKSSDVSKFNDMSRHVMNTTDDIVDMTLDAEYEIAKEALNNLENYIQMYNNETIR